MIHGTSFETTSRVMDLHAARGRDTQTEPSRSKEYMEMIERCATVRSSGEVPQFLWEDVKGKVRAIAHIVHARAMMMGLTVRNARASAHS